MSKKKNSGSYSSSARRTKGKGFAGLITAIVVLVVAVVLTVTAAFGSSGFTNPDFKTWFNSWGKGGIANAREDDIALSSVILTKEESATMGLQIVSIDSEEFEENNVPSAAEAAYTLHVTLTGDYVNPNVTASIAWDVDSELYDWARESRGTKSTRDYVKFVQEEVGSCDFILSALQPYGCPLIMNIYLQENPAANCTVKLDYLKRFSFDGEKGNTGREFNLDTFNDEGDNYIPYQELAKFGITLGTGTREPDIGMFEITVDSAFMIPWQRNLFKGYNFKQNVVYEQMLDPESLGTESSIVDRYLVEKGFNAYDTLGYRSVDFLNGNYSETQLEKFHKLIRYAIDVAANDNEPYYDLHMSIRIKTYYGFNYYGVSDPINVDGLIYTNTLDNWCADYQYNLPSINPDNGNIIL